MVCLWLQGRVGCINFAISKMENYGWGDEKHGDLSHVNGFHLENLFGVHPFYINKGMPFMIYAS